MWNESTSVYNDYISDYDPVQTVAMAFPLFLNISTREQSKAIASYIKRNLLKEFGVVTTGIKTG